MSDTIHDPTCIFDITRNPNTLVPWYLMSSFAYYIKDDPILSDSLYDTLCNRLDDEWDSIEHPHKHLIDRSALSAGTGFQLQDTDYPSIVKGAVDRLRLDQKKEKPKRKKKIKESASTDHTERRNIFDS